MEIMMMLDGAALNQLRDEFRNRPTKHPDGFSVDEFVALMLEKLELPTHKDRTAFTKDLCELFAQIDVNGDGTMEWEEFTSYCVEAGIVATRHIMTPLKYKFVEHANFVDRNSRGSCIWNVVYAEPLNNLFVFEAESVKVKIYTPKLDLIGEIAMPRGEVKPMVHCGVYIPEHHLLAVGSSDFSITFWDAHDKFKLVGSGFCRTSQIGVCWGGGRLYSWGSSNVIHMWDVSTFTVKRKFTKHSDIVLSGCAVPAHDLLLTGGMDKVINLWELGGTQWRGQLLGHARGVRQIIYIEPLDLVLSSGFECDAYGWDLGNKRQVLRLRGHRFPLVGIQPLARFGQFEPRALTGDRGGNFKVWDISKSHTGLAVCLQTFTTSSHLSKFTPRAFVTMPPTGYMVAAGLKLHLFVSRPVVAGEIVSTAALWNPVTRMFCTAADRSVALWSPEGKKLQDFYELAESAITSVTVDDRQRKLILGTQGGQITVFNFVNGAVMKTANVSHESDVTSLMYVDIDKIVVSVSWDRQLRVYDENDPDHLTLLRRVNDAHAADITCVHASRDMSLIASGCADATVHVWGYLGLKLVAQLQGHHAEITAVLFVDPYPLLITADCAGFIMFWGMRGGDIHLVNQCLHVLKNQSNARDASSTFMTASSSYDTVMVPVAGLAVERDPESQHMLLFVADESGFIHVHDLTLMMDTIGMKPVPDNKKKCLRMNYNPGMRVERTGPPGAKRRGSVVTTRSRRSEALRRRHSLRSDSGSVGSHGTSSPAGYRGPRGGGGGGGESSPSVGAGTPKHKASPARRSNLARQVLTDSASGGGGGSNGAAVASPVRSGALSPVPEGRSRSGSVASVRPSVVTAHHPPPTLFGVGDSASSVASPLSPRSDGASTTTSAVQSTRFGAALPRIARAARVLKEVPRIASWRAHRDGIITIRANGDPCAIVTCSHDKSVRVWSFHGEALGVLVMGKAERLRVRRGDIPRVPWRFAPDAASREKARLEAAQEVLATIRQERQRERERVKEMAEREAQQQAWFQEQVRLGRMSSTTPAPPHLRTRGRGPVAISQAERKAKAKARRGKGAMFSSGSRSVRAGDSSTLLSPVAGGVSPAASLVGAPPAVSPMHAGTVPPAPSTVGGALSVATSATHFNRGDVLTGVEGPGLRMSVLRQLADSESESSDDEIVVQDDLSDPGAASDKEEGKDPLEATNAAAKTAALATALATGQRKPLDSKYQSLSKEKKRHRFGSTAASMVEVDTTPSEFIKSKLGPELPPTRSHGGVSGSPSRRSSASSRPTVHTGARGTRRSRGGKGMQLSMQSAPASRATTPRLDDLDGRSRVSPSELVGRLEQRSWDMHGDSYVEDGLVDGDGGDGGLHRHPVFNTPHGYGRPRSTPVRGELAPVLTRQMSRQSSRSTVLDRLYTPDLSKRSPRLARSFSQREQMEAAQRSLRQHQQGEALMAKIDRILGEVQGSPVRGLPALASHPETEASSSTSPARPAPVITSITALLEDARSRTRPKRGSPFHRGGASSTAFSLTPKGMRSRKARDGPISVAEKAMLKLENALRDDTASVSGQRRQSLVSRQSTGSGRSARRSPPATPTNGRAVMFGSYSEKDVRELKELFDAFDQDGSGTIDASEFSASNAWQLSNLPNIASSLFESLDKDGSGELSLDELVKVVFPYASDREISEMVAFAHKRDVGRKDTAIAPLTREQEEEFRAIFAMYDTHGTGLVSQDQLYDQLAPNWGEILTRQDLMKMCAHIGLKPTQFITADDFVRLLHERM